MHCASCVGNVEQALLQVAGVKGARVNLPLAQAAVDYEPGKTDLAKMAQAVAAAGYSASPSQSGGGKSAGAALEERSREEIVLWRNRLIAAVVLLIPLMAAGYAPHAWHSRSPWVVLVIGSVMQAYVGWPYFVGAAKRLRHGGANMDTLIALGTGAAYAAGVVEFFSGSHSMSLMDGGMILTFVTLGKYLEARAKGRASLALQKLLSLAPPVAQIKNGDVVTQVPVEQVLPDEVILIRPGDAVPLDAVVLSGQSDVNQAWLTGEPLPVEKRSGDVLHAGSINGQGSLEARVTAAAGKTWLARTIELVRAAQESKADVQRLADRVVEWFVPAVLAIALVTLVAWTLSAADGWRTGLSCAVAVLIVACPCALGLATPAAVLVGSGRGAESGILIKDAGALETAGRLTTVILDKTGTITLGQPKVVAIEPATGVSREELLSLAAAAERLSTHPLARAVVDAADAAAAPRISARETKVIPGEGLEAVTEKGLVLIGNFRLLNSRLIPVPKDKIESPTQQHPGAAPLLVATNNQYLGVIIVADEIAPGSADAIAALHHLGLTTRLVSGDRKQVAEEIARRLGIQHVVAEVLPEDKQRIVRELQAQKEVVAMVGDGINDAPALAAADLGIAMGTGADVALESADMVLTRHDLMLLPRAIRLSRTTLAIIRQNLWWALGYNVILIPLAAGVLVPIFGISLSPALAAAAMAASSVSVVLNSLRLRVVRI
jgi:P-type Cu+ transporter